MVLFVPARSARQLDAAEDQVTPRSPGLARHWLAALVRQPSVPSPQDFHSPPFSSLVEGTWGAPCMIHQWVTQLAVGPQFATVFVEMQIPRLKMSPTNIKEWLGCTYLPLHMGKH